MSTEFEDACDPGGTGPLGAWLRLELDDYPDRKDGKAVRRGQRSVMEKDLASLDISNKAEATLGTKALNGALHGDTSFLTWRSRSRYAEPRPTCRDRRVGRWLPSRRTAVDTDR
jgi:hypothetical protein